MEEKNETVNEEMKDPKETADKADENATEKPAPYPDQTGLTTENPAPSPDYAAMAAADILALRAEFPEDAVNSLLELDNPTRYAELRDLGLSPREAYLATTRRSEKRVDNRSHLQSAVPRAVVGSGEGISREELEAARDLFSGLSDHEIRKLYKKVTE